MDRDLVMIPVPDSMDDDFLNKLLLAVVRLQKSGITNDQILAQLLRLELGALS